jgi:hypothetical protein
VFYFISAIIPPKEARPGLIRRSRVISDTARGECPLLRSEYLTFLKLLHCNNTYLVCALYSYKNVISGTPWSERFVSFCMRGVTVYKVIPCCLCAYLMTFALKVVIGKFLILLVI